MKNLFFSILFSFPFFAVAQTDTTQFQPAMVNDTTVYTMADVVAKYPGGETALLADIFKNTVYPQDAVEQEIQGTVLVKFIVEKDGSITNIRVLRPLFDSIDKAAMHTVSQLKKFEPASINGVPVRQTMTIPIKFTLQGDSSKEKKKKK